MSELMCLLQWVQDKGYNSLSSENLKTSQHPAEVSDTGGIGPHRERRWGHKSSQIRSCPSHSLLLTLLSFCLFCPKVNIQKIFHLRNPFHLILIIGFARIHPFCIQIHLTPHLCQCYSGCCRYRRDQAAPAVTELAFL